MRYSRSRFSLVLPALGMISLAIVAACSSSDDAPADGPTVPNTTGGMGTSEGGVNGGGGDGGVGGGGDGATGGDSAGGKTDSGPDPGPLQKHKAEMLTSLWENDTTIFQYAFSQNNNDGFGYTSGRIGFTTATGDAYLVIKCFDTAMPGAGNLMKKYEAVLTTLYNKQQMTGQIQPDISGLDAIGSYTADWKTTANTAATAPAFHSCQDQRVDVTYWTSALALIKMWGLTTALARAAFYDSTVVHGDANVKNLIKLANNDTGNTAQKVPTAPLTQVAESNFLKAFFVHRATLINSSVAWKAAIARDANYERMRANGNFDFFADIVTDARADLIFPGNGYTSNGYQACVIKPDGSVTGPAQCTAPVSN